MTNQAKPYTTETEIRNAFLSYFESKGHTAVSSCPLVPHNDPTLLFVNAGMVQFKDTFLGLESKPYTRATTAQKCVRAGGKHNDLDTVGRTARHHTFFEMLGNFSFGDYFKEDAIKFAWEFITEKLQLPSDRLYVTVFETDDEAREIWKKVTGFTDEKIFGLGEHDNFWSMGDTGPCGPCSEIFFDRGEKYTCDAEVCGIGHCDCDRYMEIWNLVFMQYNRDENGVMTPLPKPSIDTGMGLERITSIMQEVDSNYEIPIMRTLIKYIEDLTGKAYDGGHDGFPFRVIADHIRASAFLIADGVVPGNEGRNYVLRRIFRRAVRFGTTMGINETFMYKMVPTLCDLMGEQYPEIIEQKDFIMKVMKIEEEKFRETIADGLAMVAGIITEMKAAGETVFSGKAAFTLYDTYGFPIDLTDDIVEESGFTLDKVAFEEALEEQRARARAARNVKTNVAELQNMTTLLAEVPATTFTGYTETAGTSKVLAFVVDGEMVDQLAGEQDGYLVLEETPFYPEMGGQIGDIGVMQAGDVVLNITDTTKLPNGIYLHKFTMDEGVINVGVEVCTQIDVARRMKTARNHSATHIMQKVLRDTLGNHVHQAGSMVNDDRLRFDFSHIQPLTEEEILQIEDAVNAAILANTPVEKKSMSKEEAEAAGFLAFFGDKYGEEVRTVVIGPSMELCGGTHVDATGDIGSFKILTEVGIGSGIRRIEAVTGDGVTAYYRERNEMLLNAAATLKTNWHDLDKKAAELLEELKEKEREIKRLQQVINQNSVGDVASSALEIDGVKVIAEKIVADDMNGLRATMDAIKDKMDSGAVVLAAVAEDKVMLVAAVTKDLAGKKLHAGNIVKAAAAACGGGGGGRPDMAQAGGKDPAKVQDALDAAIKAIKEQLA